MPASLFIPSAEAAFIAGLTDRQMHRVVDERLLPDSVFEQRGSTRLFTLKRVTPNPAVCATVD